MTRKYVTLLILGILAFGLLLFALREQEPDKEPKYLGGQLVSEYNGWRLEMIVDTQNLIMTNRIQLVVTNLTPETRVIKITEDTVSGAPILVSGEGTTCGSLSGDRTTGYSEPSASILLPSSRDSSSFVSCISVMPYHLYAPDSDESSLLVFEPNTKKRIVS